MALSPYEENIIDFNSIIEKHPELLSDEDCLSLEQLMSSLSDDVEEISNKIAEWTEEHPKVLDALLELPPSKSGKRGLGGSTIRLTAKDAKDLIENTVRQSISKSSSQTSQTSNDQHLSNPGTT
jgi:hypothetical protein